MASISVGVMTFPRSGVDYLSGTLTEIRSKSQSRVLPIVCVGHSKTPHIPADIPCFPMSDGEWANIATQDPLYRITRNMLHTYRALRRYPSDLYIIFEDDLHLALNWDLSAAQFANLAFATVGPSWVMALCSSYDDGAFHVVWKGEQSKLLKHKSTRDFWGQQALLYPSVTMDAMVEHLTGCVASWKHDAAIKANDSDHNYRRSGDQAVKWFCAENCLPLLVTAPSLAKHVGEKCSWSGGASVAFKHPTKRFR